MKPKLAKIPKSRPSETQFDMFMKDTMNEYAKQIEFIKNKNLIQKMIKNGGLYPGKQADNQDNENNGLSQNQILPNGPLPV